MKKICVKSVQENNHIGSAPKIGIYIFNLYQFKYVESKRETLQIYYVQVPKYTNNSNIKQLYLENKLLAVQGFKIKQRIVASVSGDINNETFGI